MKKKLSNKLFTCFCAMILTVMIILPASMKGQNTVTQLSGFYKNGQVFLTWANLPDSLVFYKCYRSAIPITATSELQQCEYLGYTNFESSKDHNLSRHDGQNVYLSIDSGLTSLSSATGLFVATTLSDGDYYYAITTLKNNIEETYIVPGDNSFSIPISNEKVSKPLPGLQQVRLISSQSLEVYTMFTSMKFSMDTLLMNRAGFVAIDFALNRNHSTGNQPLKIRLHAGGGDFLTINAPIGDEMLLSPEDFFPGNFSSGGWGANENYDIYDAAKNTIPPTSGINYNFSQQRMNLIIDWAISSLTTDSNRIYIEATSFGSVGGYFFPMTYPERIAAVKLSGGCFNLAFQNDSNTACTFNTGKANRKDGDNRFGTVNSNLETNLGFPTYDILNGGWLAHHFNEKDFPVIYSINGKRDTMVGWTEKTMYYDSVNTHHLGGYFFWDNRTHNGAGKTWGNDNFDLFRYKKNESYPAFSNCSANEDFGNGSATSGASFGTINGFLDWNSSITDDTSQWKVTIFLRDLKKSNGGIIAAPPSCTVDITPRRLQHFTAKPGDALFWNITHNGINVQSGNLLYEDGVITIPGVMVYPDSVKLLLGKKNPQDTIPRNVIVVSIYPNNIVQNANITLLLPVGSKCIVRIFDFQGKPVRTLMDGELTQGLHQLNWNADDSNGMAVRPGLYFVKVETANAVETKKCMVTR